MARGRFVVRSYRRAQTGNPGVSREWFKVLDSKTRETKGTFEESRETEAFALARELNASPARERARKAGAVSTPAKRRASRANGKAGGRPRSPLTAAERRERATLEALHGAGYLNAAGEARRLALAAKLR